MIPCRVYDLDCIPYGEALDLQRRAVDKLQKGSEEDTLFLLEHPHVVTVGRNVANSSLLCDFSSIRAKGIEFEKTDRGGDITYHGPGQLVGYPIFKLETERRDIRRYVQDIESALINTCADFGIEADHHMKYRGVWTRGRKIASVGIRIAKWVTSHGFALNVNSDLSYFALMNPCGIPGCTMTSMQQELGEQLQMTEIKASVIKNLSETFDRVMKPGDKLDEIRVCAECAE